MENINRILYLFNTARLQKLSAEEKQEFKHLLEVQPDLANLYAELQTGKGEGEALGFLQAIDVHAQLRQFKARQRQRNTVLWPGRMRTSAAIASIAAALVVLFCGVFLFYFLQKNPPMDTYTAALQFQPATDKAILQLADGTRIDLSNLKEGESTLTVEGLRLRKLENGELLYEVVDLGKSTMGFNTITTPKGGKYKIKLPDGTLIELGSESKLVYPTVFASNARILRLEGEAFFEVSKLINDNKEALPFIVELADQKIEVLGTTFSVQAYANSPYTRTTLMEGAVKVIAQKGTYLLKPGDQAVLSKAKGEIQVSSLTDLNVKDLKNQSFRFEDQSLEEIMNTLARWYNVEVVYHTSLSDEQFSGVVNRYDSPVEILKLLELTGKVTFEIKGRRIMVMP